MNKLMITALQYGALPLLNFIIKRIIAKHEKEAERRKKLEEKIRKKILKEKEHVLSKANISLRIEE